VIGGGLLGMLLAFSPFASAETVAPRQECVVLLHGLWRTELSMKAVEWALSDAGYTVANVTYPSLLYPIEELAEMAVEEGVDECRGQGLTRIHFVTHSLGGILVRQYLKTRAIEGLERVVMMGPPNQGSQLADFVHSLDLLQPFAPEAIAQLTTGEESVPLQLGPVEFELGVIAGNINRRPPLPGIPDEASDGTVAVEETVVPGMVDFVELPASHTFMMWNPDVIAQVRFFLENGRFDHPD
jgi:pimeloyl-ACP methyl ester carboxylesterase